jgi:ribonuclease Z
MKLTFLGTAAGQPSLSRNTTSIAVEIENGEFILVDCGEATLLQLMRSPLKFSRIKAIFITHLHGDHIFGLPGLLCTLNSVRTEPLTIFGPKGLAKFCSVFEKSIFAFPLKIQEITGVYNEILNIVFETININVKCCLVQHTVECYSYLFTQTKIKNKIDIGKALPIVTKYTNEIQTCGYNPSKKIFQEFSKNINFKLDIVDKSTGDKIVLNARDFVTVDRPFKLVITLDNFKCDNIIKYFQTCDVLVHESTYISFIETSKEDSIQLYNQAIKNGHSTNLMASQNAINCNAKKLILTHFSNRYKITDGKLEGATSAINACKNVGFMGDVFLAQDFSEYTLV